MSSFEVIFPEGHLTSLKKNVLSPTEVDLQMLQHKLFKSLGGRPGGGLTQPSLARSDAGAELGNTNLKFGL